MAPLISKGASACPQLARNHSESFRMRAWRRSPSHKSCHGSVACHNNMCNGSKNKQQLNQRQVIMAIDGIVRARPSQSRGQWQSRTRGYQANPARTKACQRQVVNATRSKTKQKQAKHINRSKPQVHTLKTTCSVMRPAPVLSNEIQLFRQRQLKINSRGNLTPQLLNNN